MKMPSVRHVAEAPRGAGSHFRWRRGVKAGHPCWSWEQGGKTHYNGIERYPRRSELTAGHVWSGVFKAQEDIINALVDLEFESDLLHTSILAAKGRLAAAKSACYITGGVQTQPMKDKTDRIDVLLGKLALCAELAKSPATDRWSLLWTVIGWPEWDLPKTEWA